MIRTCKKCRKEKPLEDFTANRLCKFGREHSCKACTINLTKQVMETNLKLTVPLKVSPKAGKTYKDCK